VSLIEETNKIAGKHGVGRIDHIEDRLVGIKSREVYECPASTVILEAHKDLEKMVLTRHEILFKEYVDYQWALLAYTGLWLDPLKEDLEAFINKTQERVTGRVCLKLYKGGMRVVRRSSRFSIYRQSLVDYNIKTSFNQAYAEGFIELWGLPTVVYNALKNSLKLAEKGQTAKGGQHV
jgi:argininosuccinate synthase